MNKQEAIERVKNKALHHCGEKECYKDGCEKSIELNTALEIINQIDEPQKVKIPKFVAEWIDYCKVNKLTLLGAFEPVSEHGTVLSSTFTGKARDCTFWATHNQDTFARAWLDGYEVEKEPLYTVEIPNPESGYPTILSKNTKGEVILGTCYKSKGWRTFKNCQLTESEIKKDFDWAWQWAVPVEE